MSRAWLVLIAVVLCGTAADALRPGDPALADQMWDAAQTAKGQDYGSRLYVDVAAVSMGVAPWQPGYAQAQARIHAIGSGRRALLPHDRGSRRTRVVPTDR